MHEVHKPLARRYGYYVSGKFDQFNTAGPFSALIQVLCDVCFGFIETTFECSNINIAGDPTTDAADTHGERRASAELEAEDSEGCGQQRANRDRHHSRAGVGYW